jgi:XTP/dITP diphosphohydrolase
VGGVGIVGDVEKREILVATTNAGKLREILRVLDGLPIGLKTLTDFPNAIEPEETGLSFLENARQKAAHYARLSGMVTLAEDSGFEVDALAGDPGVYSARYLGENATYAERFADIYRRVRESASDDRTVRFVCALALVDGDKTLFETDANVEGLLAEEPAGPNGFGYDPIFFYSAYRRTFGEVSDEEKTAVSHRGQALRAFRDYLLRIPRA